MMIWVFCQPTRKADPLCSLCFRDTQFFQEHERQFIGRLVLISFHAAHGDFRATDLIRKTFLRQVKRTALLA